jgi:general secretion pathway protein F
MPVYVYKGVVAGNRATSGTVDADSVRAARAKLRSDGIFPTQIREGKEKLQSAQWLAQLQLPELRRVPDLELALFTNQLSTLLSAGVPLVESLEALTDQVENERLKTIVAEVRSSVNQGSSLADALGTHSGVFDSLYRSMVRAGESSGALPLVLKRLGDYVESRMRLRNKIVAAMTYPALMLVVSSVVMGVLLVQVIPTITTLLQDMGGELPLLTRGTVAVSDFLVKFWPLLVGGIAGSLLIFSRVIRTERGRVAWDGFLLRVPALGRSVRYTAISRFARTLSTLLGGGVNIVQALEIACRVSGNQVIGRAVLQARDSITQGTSIAAPLRQSGQFPSMVTHMIAVGEASGELDTMLTKLADTYDDLVDRSFERLNALLGPILLLFVAGVVVMVVLSTLLPLMNLTSSL